MSITQRQYKRSLLLFKKRKILLNHNFVHLSFSYFFKTKIEFTETHCLWKLHKHNRILGYDSHSAIRCDFCLWSGINKKTSNIRKINDRLVPATQIDYFDLVVTHRIYIHQKMFELNTDIAKRHIKKNDNWKMVYVWKLVCVRVCVSMSKPFEMWKICFRRVSPGNW